MVFLCSHCGWEISRLKTPGDEVNTNLLCPQCSQDLLKLLKKAKEIQQLLERHFQKLP